MCAQPTLVSIPPEVLDEIAFHTVTSYRPGPPHDFYNLLITSKAITISLALHARVFRSQFDYAALQRRFSAAWLTSNVLAEQLKSRWLSLKRIRKAAEAYERQQAMREVWKLDMTNVAEDLWTAFFMLLESDGKNVRHLQWAKTKNYLDAFISATLIPRAEKHTFLPESVDSALAITLSWLLTDETSLSRETVPQLEAYVGLIRPFVFGAHRYDAYFAPWSLFDLPLTDTSDGDRLPARYRYITYRPYEAHDQIPQNNGQPVVYLRRPLLVSAPIMALSAITSYFARVEFHHRVRPVAANATLNTGAGPAPHPLPSLEAPQLQPTVTPPLATAGAQYPTTNDSEVYDSDFSRLISCLNPRLVSLPAHHSFYTPGTLAGMWEGRFAFFEFDAYRDMLIGFKPPSIVKVDELLTGQQPQVWRINEYHLYTSSAAAYRHRSQSPDTHRSASSSSSSSGTITGDTRIEPLSTGHPLNAHLPLRCRFVDVDGGIEVFEEDGRSQSLFYKKYTSTSEDSPAADDVDEPILDTLITGSGHSAWGPFTLRGRIRTWDGLVTVIKDYSSTSAPNNHTNDDADAGSAHDRGRWLYRGYILAGGTNWVGRWRDTVTELQFCGYEGAFALHARR